jgi:hypothetical protein
MPLMSSKYTPLMSSNQIFLRAGYGKDGIGHDVELVKKFSSNGGGS